MPAPIGDEHADERKAGVYGGANTSGLGPLESGASCDCRFRFLPTGPCSTFVGIVQAARLLSTRLEVDEDSATESRKDLTQVSPDLSAITPQQLGQFRS
jgi:hypothetical protein